ncbi:odorant receptor 131-2-like [Amia ocellicauda]|uniref:odorant receptor 131-2-like n=1 Tax=Amia ocellicauda TaxID=2972642 RepID=UPI003464BC64
MTNVSLVWNILTYQQESKTTMNWVPTLKMIIVLSTCFFFISVNSMMLFVLRSKPCFRETPRYILFAHMLLNDSIHLLISMLLFALALMYLYLVRAVCAVLVLLSSTTFYNTPLNLAVMALERYIAICFPLRHSEMATPQRTGVAIAVVWFLGSVNHLIDVFVPLITEPSILLTPVYCKYEQILMFKWQADAFQGFTAFYFVCVGLILVFTYVAIMLEARSVSSDKASVTKARNTVLLHTIQLCLCLTSFLYGVIEALLARMVDVSVFIHLRYMNFIVLLILPRCLSPLIYGLRDESLKTIFKYYFTCGSKKVKPVRKFLIKTDSDFSIHNGNQLVSSMN